MEINKVNGDILGVVANEDIVEGRMVVLTSHSQDYDFGSKTDLPGVKLPSTAEEAKRSRFVITWAVDNRQPPYFQPMPAYAFSLRKGFGSASNVPFTAEVWLTWPGYQNGRTIPSGMSCLAYGAGTYTAPSGSFIYSADLETPGDLLSVSYAAETRGKLQHQATMDNDVVVASVVHYDSATGNLTFTTKEY